MPTAPYNWQNDPQGVYQAKALYNPTGGSGGAAIPTTNGVPYGAQAASINQFMTNQAMLPYVQNLPGYAKAVGQRSENTQQMLTGELPDDVVSQIAQQAAERGIAGGSPGGPNANAAYLRSIGLSSLDMMGEGSKQLTQSIADTPVPELWNPASLFVPLTLGQQEKDTALASIAASNKGAANRGSGGEWGDVKDGNYIQYGGVGGWQRRF